MISRILELTKELDGLSFSSVQNQAPRLLADILPGARLETAYQQTAGTGLNRGPATLPDGEHVWLDYYLGPPEPVWFTVHSASESSEVLLKLELFFQRLAAALQSAGFAEELARQSRSDWLTGLPQLADLERKLQSTAPDGSYVGLLSMEASPNWRKLSVDDRKLVLRNLAHALRMLLTEGEAAFAAGDGRLALLIPESELARFTAFLGRHAPGAACGWAQLVEAPGLQVLRLAAARMAGGRTPDPARQPQKQAATLRAEPVKVRSGSSTALNLATPVMRDWHFPVPLTLIMDIPVGHALQALPGVAGKTVVVTQSTSVGYVLDLNALRPDGLILEPISLGELRSQMQRVSEGERVYSGPPLEDPLLPREREVWRHLAGGLANPQIALNLQISEKTVANYISSLLDKLSAQNRADLALAYWGNSGT